MRRTIAATLFALAVAASAFGQAGEDEARREADMGARAYRARKFAEAEQHFRRALELDPSQKNLPLLIARSAHQQYRPGDESPASAEAGERAVAAYQAILDRDPQNEDAFKAVSLIYGQMGREDKVRELLLWRANDFSAPAEKRAESFAALVTRLWQCSYEVTERAENKGTEDVGGKPEVRYKMPADAGDFLRARQCVNEGLGLAEQAVALDPKNANALSHKVNMLREAAKLSEMEGSAAQEAEYDRLYNEAREAYDALRKEAEARPRAGEGAETAGAAPPQPPAEPGAKRSAVTGGILNGKAVSKPQPVYPPAAKAAGVQGTVVVRVVVDEAGNVAEAEAVGGHPLLREAAVAAARRARFPPTRLSGQPVRVAGRLTYNFVLQP